MSEVGSSPLPTPVFTWEQNPKKAAWPVRRSPSLGWHIRNGPHSSVPCLSSPVRAAAGGFPSRLCSLSQALKVVQVTGAMPPALTLQPELTLCAQLWVRAPLRLPCSTFPSLPTATTWVRGLDLGTAAPCCWDARARHANGEQGWCRGPLRMGRCRVPGGCTCHPLSISCRAGSPLALPQGYLDQGRVDFCTFSVQLHTMMLNSQGKSQELVSQQLCEGWEGCLPFLVSIQITTSASSCCSSPGDQLSSWHSLAVSLVPGPLLRCQPRAPQDL